MNRRDMMCIKPGGWIRFRSSLLVLLFSRDLARNPETHPVRTWWKSETLNPQARDVCIALFVHIDANEIRKLGLRPEISSLEPTARRPHDVLALSRRVFMRPIVYHPKISYFHPGDHRLVTNSRRNPESPKD